MRLVENQEWAAVLLVQPCALLMAALWAAVPVGSHTESLNAAMVSFQYAVWRRWMLRRAAGFRLVGRLMVGVCQHISTLLNILWSRREPPLLVVELLLLLDEGLELNRQLQQFLAQDLGSHRCFPLRVLAQGAEEIRFSVDHSHFRCLASTF